MTKPSKASPAGNGARSGSGQAFLGLSFANPGRRAATPQGVASAIDRSTALRRRYAFFSEFTIHEMPNLSTNIANRSAQKVSPKGMWISLAPSESAA